MSWGEFSSEKDVPLLKNCQLCVQRVFECKNVLAFKRVAREKKKRVLIRNPGPIFNTRLIKRMFFL